MRIKIADIIVLRHDDRLALDAEQLRLLAEDIERHGQLQPIAVAEMPGGKFQLVAGRRRCAALELLGRDEIEAHIVELKTAVEIPALSENLKRSNLSPLEEALQVRWLHTEGRMSMNDIAETTGHSHSWVQDRLALAELPENLREAVHKRKLSISAAMQLEQIDDVQWRDYLVHCAVTNGCSVHQAQAWLLDYQSRKMLTANPDPSQPVPQPPPLPPAPEAHCFLCHERTPGEQVVVVRVCTSCVKEVQAAVVQPPADGGPGV